MTRGESGKEKVGAEVRMLRSSLADFNQSSAPGTGTLIILVLQMKTSRLSGVKCLPPEDSEVLLNFYTTLTLAEGSW